MSERGTRAEVVKVVVQSSEPVLHRTASNQVRREDALTTLNASCSLEELESLARIVIYADVAVIEQEARRRWGSAAESD